MPDRPPFAALLRELRRVAGLTQGELAERAGVGVRTLRDLEVGRATRPQRSTVDLLADALELRGTERARFAAASRGRRAVAVHLRPVPPLFGRDGDVAALSALLEVADLITLVGLSGVGRASVALTIAHQVADQFPAGVGAVSLTEASTVTEVIGSAVSALGLAHLDEVPLRLSTDRALLVVLGVDRNAAAGIAAITWLREHGPRLRVIATSRHPLGLPGEHEWSVPPLDVPPPSATGAQVFAYPATVLFLDRLRRVRQRPVDVSEASTLGALVRRLGGLPLALELAAARGRVLELGDMLARASTGEAGEEGGPPADAAGQSVRESVLASWRLLDAGERESLCWLSVFEWRWSMDLAEELLVDGPAKKVDDVVALVDRLVGLGLVAVRPQAPELRFWLLEAVRSVARQEAVTSGLLDPARDRHAAMMARLAERTSAEPAARLESLHSDMRAALDHLERRGGVPRPRAELDDADLDGGAGVSAGADGAGWEVAGLQAEVRRWMHRRGLPAS